ncbi:MAG: spore germination protein [Clostridia bacterium]|nr:spore germination protein [Clostridia bacterium]MDD4146204.1 spore germination protein [Clostridia bacterium]MDD4665626.1 spore germination protein [Clostridia bacterium]
MSFFQQLRKKITNLIVFDEGKEQEGFLLVSEKENGDQERQEGKKSKQKEKKKSNKQGKADKNKQFRVKKEAFKKPVRVSKTPLSLAEQREKNKEKNMEKSMKKEPFFPEKLFVSSSLEVNKGYLEKIYSLPKNKDIILREFYIALHPPLKAFVLFIDGLAEKEIINNSILKPLMVLLDEEAKIEGSEIAEYIKEHLLPGHDVQVLEKYQQILDWVNYGGTAIFIEGCAQCLVVETKGWDKRAVGKPEVEQVIMGPHEAFNETLRSNTGLIRKALRNENLITEMVKVGSRNKIDVAIMYLEDLTNPQLIAEVKRRITSIKTDYVGVSGVLEQFIEDEPFRLSPQILTTERPDRVVSFLVEGHVTVIVDGGPQALIVPATLFSLLHSSEDYYLRMPYGNFLRILRVFALFIAILTPSIYVSIVTFHQEMIPTELLLAIAASRATVPFPTIFEVFAMEFAFELIREAGVRVPGVIGNTIGIVGALILGQAAVQAGIVSPILIIIIAITGLASFAIPNYSISFAFRGRRFIFTILAAFFGFFGISGGLFLFLLSLVNMKSFGVPFLAPISPKTKTGPDVVLRGPVWSMEERVDYLDPLERSRQPNISRGWIKNRRGGRAK